MITRFLFWRFLVKYELGQNGYYKCIYTHSPAQYRALKSLCVCAFPRSGSLFNTGFLRRMLVAAVQHSMEDIQPLVKTLICEADCTTLKSFSVTGQPILANQGTWVTTLSLCFAYNIGSAGVPAQQRHLKLNSIMNVQPLSIPLIRLGRGETGTNPGRVWPRGGVTSVLQGWHRAEHSHLWAI